MNYFAHALPFLDNPYYAVGTGIPDWLTVADRQVRVRHKHARPVAGDADPRTSAVAGGLVQHIADDLRFHETRAFVETSLELATGVRRVLGSEAGYRASLVGHLLVELLLDAALAAEHPPELEAYYRILESVDVVAVQDIVNRMAPQPTRRLAPMIRLFWRARILWDYLEDDKLLVRLNQVMRRVGFDRLPEDVVALLPAARQLVLRRRGELLDGIPVPPAAWRP